MNMDSPAGFATKLSFCQANKYTAGNLFEAW